MANFPLETVIINPLERPTSKDINQAQMQAHADMRMLVREMFYGQYDSFSEGFVGDSFKPFVTNGVARQLSFTNGVFFQFNSNAENNIGGIQGLTDAYPYKAAFNYASNTIIIPINEPPAVEGQSRIDRIEVRVPFGDERLKDSTSVGIFNSTLKTFSSDNKYKLLSSTLTTDDVQTIAAGSSDPAAQPIIYHVGTASATPVAPAFTPGYLTVALVTSTYGQANLLAGDISDERLLLKLNPTVGGTGSSVIGDAGAVAYSNGANIEYTRATLFGIPQTGHILVSDGASTPNWIGPAVSTSLLISSGANANPTWLVPGAAGDAVISDGTEWQSLSLSDVLTRYYTSTITGGVYSNSTIAYTAIPGLMLADIALRTGNVRIELRPVDGATSDYNARLQNSTAGGRRGYILITLEKGPVSIDRVFSFELEPNTTGYIALPSTTENITDAGDWTVTVSARVGSAGDSTIFVQNCELVVSQG